MLTPLELLTGIIVGASLFKEVVFLTIPTLEFPKVYYKTTSVTGNLVIPSNTTKSGAVV